MGRRSSIEQLPDAVIAEINKALASGRYTLDDVAAMVAKLGHGDDVSRSALGRYAKREKAMRDSLRRSRNIASALVRDTDDEERESQLGRVNIELMQSVVMKILASGMAEGDDEMPEFSPLELARLAKGQKDMIEALATDDGRRRKIRSDALADAAKVIDKIQSRGGITKERADEARQAILGLNVG